MKIKILLSLSLLIILSSSFKIFSFQKQAFVSQSDESLSCSDTRIKLVNDSISECQMLGLTLSTQCIKNYLFNHSNGEKWDVIAQNPQKSDLRSSYWSYDDCSIRYERYGQLKITYTIWKASVSNQKISKMISNLIFMSKNQMKNDENEICSEARIKIAKESISYCQNNDPSLQVSCIKNNIRGIYGQKWNAVVSSEGKSQYSARYQYSNGCIVEQKAFGPRKRNYLVWKAE